MKRSLLSFAARNWPFENGSGRLIDRYGGDICLGSGEIDCKTADGFTMRVLANDHIGRHIALQGAFDASIIRALCRFAEDGDHCLDIGANIGYVSALLLHRIPNSTIVSVEPQPAVGKLLRHNLSQFDAQRWRVVEAGLSDDEGEAFMRVDKANLGASAIVDASAEDTIPIPLISTDRFLAGFDRLDLIKMDIEGHEQVVFEAGLDQLKRLQPKAILFEDIKKVSGPKSPIGQAIATLGYRLFALRKRLTRTELVPVSQENAAQFHDFIAVSCRREIPAAARAVICD